MNVCFRISVIAAVLTGCTASDTLTVRNDPVEEDLAPPAGDADVSMGDSDPVAGDAATPAGDTGASGGDAGSGGDAAPAIGDADGPACQLLAPAQTDPGATVHHGNIIDRILSAHCERVVGCSAGGDWGMTFPDVPTCIGYFHAVDPNAWGRYPLKPRWPHLWGLSDATLYTIDSDRAEACFTALRSSACDRTFDPLTNPDCVAATTGRLQPGACCDYRGGCAPGETCEVDVIESPGEVGQCRPYRQLGESCELNTTPCAPGTHCEDQQCTADRSAGDACLSYYEKTWWSHNTCGDLLCAVDTCVARRAVGDTCTVTEECPPASTCLDLGGGLHCVANAGPGSTCYDGTNPFAQCANGFGHYTQCAVWGDGTCKAAATALGDGCYPYTERDCGPPWLLECSGVFWAGQCVQTSEPAGCAIFYGLSKCHAGEYCDRTVEFGACVPLERRPVCDPCP